jgi:hypothetical protein
MPIEAFVVSVTKLLPATSDDIISFAYEELVIFSASSEECGRVYFVVFVATPVYEDSGVCIGKLLADRIAGSTATLVIILSIELGDGAYDENACAAASSALAAVDISIVLVPALLDVNAVVVVTSDPPLRTAETASFGISVVRSRKDSEILDASFTFVAPAGDAALNLILVLMPPDVFDVPKYEEVLVVDFLETTAVIVYASCRIALFISSAYLMPN